MFYVKDANDEPIPSGIYLISLTAGKETKSIEAIMLK